MQEKPPACYDLVNKPASPRSVHSFGGARGAVEAQSVSGLGFVDNQIRAVFAGKSMDLSSHCVGKTKPERPAASDHLAWGLIALSPLPQPLDACF